MSGKNPVLKAVPAETILVTGSAGFIAFHVIEALLRSGRSVVGIDNFDDFYPRAVKERNLADLRAIAKQTGRSFRFVETDIAQITQTFSEDQDFTAVIHLGAKAGVRPSLTEPEAYLHANVTGTLRILEFCRARGIGRIIFGSSSSVYGDDTPAPFSETAHAVSPISPYAVSKRAGELYCSTYATLYPMTIAALRFFTVYGPRQRPDLAIHKFARQISEGTPLVLYGDGSNERDYTYVTDIVQGVMGALQWTAGQKPGTYDIFNLGGSQTTSLKRLVALLEENLGVKAKIQWAPMQPGDVQRTFADTAKARRILGYSPKIKIDEGIAKFVTWFTPRKKAA